MRTTAFLLSFISVAALAAPALAGPVSPLANGDFEIFAPFGGAALQGTPVDGPGVGVGRQVLGCTRSANVIWSSDCRGAPRDPAAELQLLLSDPQGEVEAWTAPGPREGDLAVVAPADQGIWHAAAWSQYPSGSIAFGDHDGDLDREASILPGNAMLYQSFAAASPHTLIPAGRVETVTASFEKGAPAGSLVFVLDSFPLESAADWPQAFINYQLFMPAGSWSFSGGVATIDPLKGSLSDPAAGGLLVEGVGCVSAEREVTDEDTLGNGDATVGVEACANPLGINDHPTAAQWQAASPDERRAILMELRITQLTFWNLAAGTQLDDVAIDVRQ